MSSTLVLSGCLSIFSLLFFIVLSSFPFHHGLVYPSPWSCISFTIVLYILHHGLVYPSPWSCISFTMVLYILHHGLVYPSPWSCISFTMVLYILHHGLLYPSPWSCISFDLRLLSIPLVSSNLSDKFTFFQVSEWLFLNTKWIQDWAYISFSYKSWFHFDNSDCLARVHRCASIPVTQSLTLD